MSYYPPNIPWPEIHEYILEAGYEQRPTAILKKALREIHRLIPFDLAKAVFLNEAGIITNMETINIPEQFQKSYPDWYYRQRANFARTRLSDNRHIFYTTWDQFRYTDFGQIWVRPLNMKYSAGICIDTPEGRTLAVLMLYRTHCKAGFGELEMAMLRIIQPHLANLSANFENAAFGSSATDIRSRIQEFRQLTEREAEIAALLCQGARTATVSSKLFISPGTVYRHINNIFEKLQVSSRQELIAVLLGTDNRDVEGAKLRMAK